MARTRPKNNIRTRRGRSPGAPPKRGLESRVAGREGAGVSIPRRTVKERALGLGESLKRPARTTSSGLPKRTSPTVN